MNDESRKEFEVLWMSQDKILDFSNWLIKHAAALQEKLDQANGVIKKAAAEIHMLERQAEGM